MQEGQANILVVDDDMRIRRLLDRYLSRNGMSVLQAENGRDMRDVLDEEDIDLILLDLMMPGEDGISLARSVRQQSDVPIIMVTGRSDTVDKVVGLEVGADDYVTKPFDERELLARVRTVLRRHHAPEESEHHAPEQEQELLEFDGWKMDLMAHELHNPYGELVYLTRHEFLLLTAFLKRPNRTWTRDEIMDLVAGREWSSADRSIDVLVGKLRKKIEPDAKQPKYIHTVRGVGYKFSIGH